MAMKIQEVDTPNFGGGGGTGSGGNDNSNSLWRDEAEDNPVQVNGGGQIRITDNDDSSSEGGGDDEASEMMSVITANNNKEKHQQEVIAKLKDELRQKDNTNIVRIWRIVVLVILFATAAGVSLGLYKFATNKEEEQFRVAFEIHSQMVLDSFSTAVERKLVAFATLSNALTNYAMDQKERDGGGGFPMITYPNFETSGADFRTQADSPVIHWCPMVNETTRDQWEEYALQHRFQIDESHNHDKLLRQTEDDVYGDLLPSSGESDLLADAAKEAGVFFKPQDQQKPPDYNVTFVIAAAEGDDDAAHNNTMEVQIPVLKNVLQDGTGYNHKIWNELAAGSSKIRPPGSGPWFPRWQRSPVNHHKQFILNSDVMQAPFLFGVLPSFLSNPKTIVTKYTRFTMPNHPFYNNVKLSQFRYTPDWNENYIGDPVSFMVYPVFHKNYNASLSPGEQRKDLAGVLQTNLFWRLYFANVLPPNIRGIICVLENSFSQTFAYRIDGPSVTFLGEEDPVDLYDGNGYRDMGVTIDATSYVSSRASPLTRSYNTVPLHETFGLYTLRVYPSEDTENEFKSNQPLVFTLVVAMVFFFTVLVFIVFDWLVERRQRILLNRALQSGALVSSLFPEQVQDRLYNEHDVVKKKKRTASTWKVGDNNNNNASSTTSNSSTPQGGGQIADVYNNTTIFFADLAGFTSWSSKREPKDVFLLLETLYSSFDKIAESRSVYKIETIGDCYVAITGCPNAQADHAVIMVKFARDCMAKMIQLVHELADTLGEDTRELGFRVGLHSGPVTAGVLRGKNARFQLFGDTVNTASRMESNGVKGKIHVSQATADELVASGHKLWLTPRQDKIIAKGKGEMQTYWVSVAKSTRTASSYRTSVTNDTSSDHLNTNDDGFINNREVNSRGSQEEFVALEEC